MKKLFIATFISVFMLSLSSCGQNTEEIFKFQNELNTVVTQIEELDTELNALDVTSPDAASVALEKLSDLNTAFDSLSKIEVTDDEYSYITELAVEGADYMSQAYELFDKAYGQGAFDEENAELAYKYLERATTRVRVIVSMLHGEVPDGVQRITTELS